MSDWAQVQTPFAALTATRHPDAAAGEASAPTAHFILVLRSRHDHLRISQPGTFPDHYTHSQVIKEISQFDH